MGAGADDRVSCFVQRSTGQQPAVLGIRAWDRLEQHLEVVRPPTARIADALPEVGIRHQCALRFSIMHSHHRTLTTVRIRVLTTRFILSTGYVRVGLLTTVYVRGTAARSRSACSLRSSLTAMARHGHIIPSRRTCTAARARVSRTFEVQAGASVTNAQGGPACNENNGWRVAMCHHIASDVPAAHVSSRTHPHSGQSQSNPRC